MSDLLDLQLLPKYLKNGYLEIVKETKGLIITIINATY